MTEKDERYFSELDLPIEDENDKHRKWSMKTKFLVVLLCLFVSFGTVYVYGYGLADSETQYEAIERENQQADIQYQLNEIREQLEQQRIRDQIDQLYDCDCDCGEY